MRQRRAAVCSIPRQRRTAACSSAAAIHHRVANCAVVRHCRGQPLRGSTAPPRFACGSSAERAAVQTAGWRCSPGPPARRLRVQPSYAHACLPVVLAGCQWRRAARRPLRPTSYFKQPSSSQDDAAPYMYPPPPGARAGALGDWAGKRSRPDSTNGVSVPAIVTAHSSLRRRRRRVGRGGEAWGPCTVRASERMHEQALLHSAPPIPAIRNRALSCCWRRAGCHGSASAAMSTACTIRRTASRSTSS